MTRSFAILSALSTMLLALAAAARADVPQGFLETVHKHTLLTSTVPENGDQNPYAIVIAPADFGRVHKDDVLVTNFNNSGNLQGLGSTIVAFTPSTRALTTFARIPRNLPGCPGGVGLSTAMAVLKTGWVIVGSAPSQDGTTATRGKGCLIVLDAKGQVAAVWADDRIDGPWGNMAVIDRGDSATLFVSMAGYGVQAPGQPVLNNAAVLRLDVTIPAGGKPTLAHETVIGHGFGQKADREVFMIGPTGLALGHDGTLYVSDAIANRISAIPDAATRPDSAGVGRTVTTDGFLRRPLALTTAPNGHLLAVNGKNGQVVEIDAATGKQLYAQWIDANRAQQPPGNGDLFGIAITPSGDGFYYVEDELNALVLAH